MNAQTPWFSWKGFIIMMGSWREIKGKGRMVSIVHPG
jgi:hypothetical protein